MAEQFTPNMSTTRVTNEIPSGALDASNTTFTLVNKPAAGGLQIYLNGSKLAVTTDYTLSGKTITMVDAPRPNDVLDCCYFF